MERYGLKEEELEILKDCKKSNRYVTGLQENYENLKELSKRGFVKIKEKNYGNFLKLYCANITESGKGFLKIHDRSKFSRLLKHCLGV